MINSKEQMMTEKLTSLLIFGPFSTRYKDIFDICYLMEYIDKYSLKQCMDIYIFNNPAMKENNINDVLIRMKQIFLNKRYRQRISTTEKNWTDLDIDEVLNRIIYFLESFCQEFAGQSKAAI